MKASTKPEIFHGRENPAQGEFYRQMLRDAPPNYSGENDPKRSGFDIKHYSLSYFRGYVALKYPGNTHEEVVYRDTIVSHGLGDIKIITNGQDSEGRLFTEEKGPEDIAIYRMFVMVSSQGLVERNCRILNGRVVYYEWDFQRQNQARVYRDCYDADILAEGIPVTLGFDARSDELAWERTRRIQMQVSQDILDGAPLSSIKGLIETYERQIMDAADPDGFSFEGV